MKAQNESILLSSNLAILQRSKTINVCVEG